MRILLVDPPFHAFMKYDRWYYPTGLAQLAAILHAEGHDVRVYDADRYFEKDPATRERSVMIRMQQCYYDNVDDMDHAIWKHFRSVLTDYDPEVVGVSVYTCKLKSALNALKLVRQFNPNIRTCVGGPHVNALPETFLNNDDVSTVFTGWADVSFPRWLAQGSPQGICHGEPEEVDVKGLPYSRRQALMFQDNYSPEDLGMLTCGRGCVGRCTFCSAGSMLRHRTVVRTEDSIRRELIELIGEWNVSTVNAADPSFTCRPALYKPVATLFKDFHIPWRCTGRWATITKDLIDHFVECGCNSIGVGLESGSDKILRQMRKGATRKIIREKAKILNDLGLKWQLFCIVGFPDETEEDMMQTRDLAMEIEPSLISLNSMTPLPGTEVYGQIPDMTPEFASALNQHFPNYCFSRHMDLERFRSIFSEMMETFDTYNRAKRGGLRD